MKTTARPTWRAVSRAAAIVVAGSATVHAQAQTVPPSQTVDIIGAAPLPGQGVDRAVLPYTTQVLRRGRIDEAQADNLTDLLQRGVPGLQVNEIQGSPFQADLTFRGFRASGLIGASQGLSVFLDGVRINEPFGDVVNWDLVPEFALDSVSLVPGANPAFGLNTLGGSIALTTARASQVPGLRLQASTGSFGRHRLDLSHGGRTGDLEHVVTVGLFDEKGWRDESPGRLGTLSARLSRQTSMGDVSLSLLFGRSRLVGNGLVPQDTFDEDGVRTADLGRARPQAVYTHPDLTRNRLGQLALSWQHTLASGMQLEALAWTRHTQRDTVNGDEAEEFDSADPTAPNAAFNRTATRQRAAGLSLGLSGRQGAHRWQAGASAERARVTYEQTEQEGNFSASRGVEPLAGEDPELSAAVRGTSRTLGAYVSDTWQLQPATHLTGTLRLNEARVSNTLTSVDDDTEEIRERPTESFRYRSLNPALGLVHRFDGGLAVFGNVARNTRVPTVIELGCADPAEPCRLPAGLQADPYLKQVRSTTVEAGLRWGSMTGTGGSITAYRTDNRDDIVFRAVSVTGQRGYFQNVERTRHQGVDAEWRWRSPMLDLAVMASHLDATYQFDGVLRMGERNVLIRPGTRIAGLPRQQLKLSADARVAPGWQVGADLQLVTRRGVAGNEDGFFENDEDEQADFSLPGYGVVNLRLSWKPASVKGLELTAKVNNLLDRRYASFGALAETVFDAAGRFTGDGTEALFVAPGAPRSLFVGLRYTY